MSNRNANLNRVIELEVAMKKAMDAQAFTEASDIAAAILVLHPTHQLALEIAAEASAELQVSEAAALRLSSTPVFQLGSDEDMRRLTEFDGGWDDAPRTAPPVSSFARVDAPFGEDEEAAQSARRQYLQDAHKKELAAPLVVPTGPHVSAPTPALGFASGLSSTASHGPDTARTRHGASTDDGRVTQRPLATPPSAPRPGSLSRALERLSDSVPAYLVDLSGLEADEHDPHSATGTSATPRIGLATEQHADAREMYTRFIAGDFVAADLLAAAILERDPDHGIALAVHAECEAAASGRPTMPPGMSMAQGKPGH